MTTVRDNIAQIRERIAEAALRSGRRPEEVKLMAVTKTVDDERIVEAIECGVDIIGENYVQEAKRKLETMGHSIAWHLIGHLQSNKAKYAVRFFDMIESVDRMSLARELDRRAEMIDRVVPVLIEVNISGEDTKSGVQRGEAISLIAEMARLEHLAVKGLMTLPAWFDDPEDARPSFTGVRELRDMIVDANLPGVEMRELSMGMTDDFEVAVEEGATIVRIGRALFGERI